MISIRDFLIPYLEVTKQPFYRVTFSPSQKGHPEMPGTPFSLLSFYTSTWQIVAQARESKIFLKLQVSQNTKRINTKNDHQKSKNWNSVIFRSSIPRWWFYTTNVVTHDPLVFRGCAIKGVFYKHRFSRKVQIGETCCVIAIWRYLIFLAEIYTRKSNMEPENRPVEKENHLPNHHVQVLS